MRLMLHMDRQHAREVPPRSLSVPHLWRLEEEVRQGVAAASTLEEIQDEIRRRYGW